MITRVFIIDTNVLVAGLITREADSPTSRIHDKDHSSPDPEDAHLWALLTTDPSAVLITGDRLLLENPRPQSSVISPSTWAEHFRA